MEVNIINHTARHHFEAEINGATAFIDYQMRPNAIIVYHTEVPAELEGQGIAAALTKYVLEYATEQRLGVVPLCPYMRAYLKKHSEYEHLVKSAKDF